MPQNTTRILIIDDDEDDFLITSEYIRHIPASDFEIDWCYRYEEALEKMCQGNYDLYFTDYRLGAKSGVDLLKEAQDRGCEGPIILLTGKGNREVDMEAMQLGAVDYLIKTELSVEKMERSIRYALERATHLRALKANEKKYRSIFAKSKDLVFLADEMLDFQDVNDAAFTLLGYTREELMQMNLCDFIEQAQHKKYLLHTLQSRKEIDDWEITLTTKGGEKRYCILSAAFDEGNKEIDFVQGIIHDITTMRKEEKATLQSEKLAATGRLVRTLAHEVRNPLNNITLSTEQLLADNPDDNAMMYLGIIQRNSERISNLITELLNTSRPSDIVLERTQLQGLVDEVISAAIDRLTLKRIRLSVSYPNEIVWVDADRGKLIIALLNIFINAIEAMTEGEGQLEVSLRLLGAHALLRITDNGCGIPEENISRLFEPYFTQKRNGMGLGLAFTLGILQAHKAAIDVASKTGEGTTFNITFPLAGIPIAAIDEQESETEAANMQLVTHDAATLQPDAESTGEEVEQ